MTNEELDRHRVAHYKYELTKTKEVQKRQRREQRFRIRETRQAYLHALTHRAVDEILASVGVPQENYAKRDAIFYKVWNLVGIARVEGL